MKLAAQKLAGLIRDMTEDERMSFAARCKTSVGYLRQLAGGHRNPSMGLITRLQQQSDARIEASDWFVDVVGEKPGTDEDSLSFKPAKSVNSSPTPFPT